jgi:hypothetical protein
MAVRLRHGGFGRSFGRIRTSFGQLLSRPSARSTALVSAAFRRSAWPAGSHWCHLPAPTLVPASSGRFRRRVFPSRRPGRRTRRPTAYRETTAVKSQLSARRCAHGRSRASLLACRTELQGALKQSQLVGPIAHHSNLPASPVRETTPSTLAARLILASRPLWQDHCHGVMPQHREITSPSRRSRATPACTTGSAGSIWA